ncbi:hypothetical protein ABW19_dt0201919 [Dactylella cylindrospora]|nr:hypothetical protein ABW19_dt0201919 [Dactylella cylindrospora]
MFNQKILVISEFKPSVFLQAEFPSGEEIQLGNTIKQKDAQSPPQIIITPGEPSFEKDGGTYTLCMTCPDAIEPPDPTMFEFCHWLVTDIRPQSGTVDLSTAKTLIEYRPPEPHEEDSTKLRFCLLLFRNGKTTPRKPDERKKWGLDHPTDVGVKHYAQKNDLKLVGANFFFLAGS